MSEAIQKIGFGAINDNDESLKGKSGGGAFGLNTGYLTKLEYNPNAGKDNSAGDAVDITFTAGDREFRRRIYDVTRVYDKDGNQLTDDTTDEYIKIYNANLSQAQAVVIHAIKATGVTQEQINSALAVPPTNFADWAKILTSLVPADFDKKPIDAFLEYQWKISDNADRTFLELPKNMKGGKFLCPTMRGNFTPVREWEGKDKDDNIVVKKGLAYKDESGNLHIFVRNESFMESPKANMQKDGEENVAQQALGQATGANNAKTSTW